MKKTEQLHVELRYTRVIYIVADTIHTQHTDTLALRRVGILYIQFFTHCCIYTYYTISLFSVCLFLYFQLSTVLVAPPILSLYLSLSTTSRKKKKKFNVIATTTLLSTLNRRFPLIRSSSTRRPISVALLHPHREKTANPYHCPSSNRTNVKSGVSALSSTSTAFGTVASNARLDQTGNGHIDEALRQQALAEEEAAMNQYKVHKKFDKYTFIFSKLHAKGVLLLFH